MKKAIREHLKKHFAMYILITNALAAIGVAAFAILGILTSYMSVPALLVNAAVFGVIYAIGKFGNEQLEDLKIVEEFEQEHPDIA